MARSIKGITIEIEGKTSGLVKSLNEANKAIRDTESQLRQVNKALKLDPGNADLIKAKQNALAKEIEETKKKLDAEKQAAEDAAEALQKGAITQGEYDALQADIALTTNKLKDLEKEAKNSSSVLGEQMKAAGGKIQEVGGKISEVGESLLPMTAAVTGIAAGAMKSFDEVDGAYDTLITKTGAVGDALSGMQDIVDEIATTMPTTFEDAAQAVGEVNTRFGLVGKDLQDLSTQFLQFAKINGTDVSGSIDSVQKGLAAFGLSASDAGSYLDTLNAVGQRTGVNVSTLAQNLISAAPALTEMGLSANEAAQFLGEVEVSGVDTSAVLTGLRTALKNAAKDGKSMDDALGEIQASMTGAATDAEGLQAAYELFGTRAGAAIYSAVKQGTLSFEELKKSATDSLGSVADTYAGTIDGIDSTTTALNSLKLAGAQLGAAISEVLAPVLQKVAEVLKSFTERWRELSPEMQKAIVVVGGIVGALGPVLIVIGKLVGFIGSVVTALGTIAPVVSAIGVTVGGFVTATLLPILPIIAGIIAGITALILVIKNWDKIVEVAKKIFEKVSSAIKTAATAVKTAVSNAFTAAGRAVKAALDAMYQWAIGAKVKVLEAFVALGKGIAERASGIFNAVKTGVSKAIEFLKGLPRQAITWGADLIRNFVTGIKNNVGKVIQAIKNMGQKIRDFIGFSEPEKGPLSNFHTYAPDMMKLFAKGIRDNTGLVTNAVSGAASGTATAMQADYSGVLNQIATNTGTAAVNTGRASGDINVTLKVGSQQFGRAVVTAQRLTDLRNGGR